jgi:hypothetical protein
MFVADHYLDRTIGEGDEDRSQGWWVKQDRIDRVNVALRYIAMRKPEFCTIEAESESDPGKHFGRDDWKGTADVTLVGNGLLEVIDYKDGRGYVSEKNNPQMNDYAGGKLMSAVMDYRNSGTIPDIENCGIEKIRMTIIQPKTSNPIRFEEVTPQELYERVKAKAIAAKATDDPDAPLVPGKHCQWCKHGRAGNCEAKNREGMEGLNVMTTSTGKNDFIAAIQSGELSLSDMPGDKLAAILDATASVKKLIKMAEDEAFKRIDSEPNAVPGYEMGTGNSKSVWIDDQEIVNKKLRGMRMKKDEVLIPTLISPAKARKHEGLTDRQKQNLEKMIEKVPGSKKVVKSKAQPTTADMFAGVEVIEPAPAIAAPVELPNFL